MQIGDDGLSIKSGERSMRQLAGKAAFVTGGASGIGLALGQAFAQAGMKVMLADVEADALAAAVESLRQVGPDVRGIACDVADPASVARAAAASFEAFGNIHVVCNNAGVAAGGGIDNISVDNWRWVIDVNLMGVVYGVRSFLPHIRAHGEGGHIVNTASMAGMNGGLGMSPYTASKFAVVGMSEGLAAQLKPHGIGVSVLCPSYVRTRIGESGRNRLERYGQAQPLDPASPAAAIVAEISRQLAAGLDPAAVAARVLAAIQEDEFYVFTHPNMREEVEPRFCRRPGRDGQGNRRLTGFACSGPADGAVPRRKTTLKMPPPASRPHRQVPPL
jgi:NAD(P)-dependent dehydrogenase (short-subunit alcohol dehydrogenase family)